MPHTEIVKLPLHQKHVTPISLDRLRSLSSVDPSVVSELEHALGWLTDPTRYQSVPFNSSEGVPIDRMLPGDIEAMAKVGVIRPLHPDELPLGAVTMFWVAELQKKRRRPIKWPKEINSTLGRDTLRPLAVVPRHVVRLHVRKGDWAIVVDMKQWFDQLPLAREVSRHMCFRDKRSGTVFCLDRLPMGQRHSTEVATAVMRRLLDFKPEGATIDYAADNVRFVGSKDSILAAFLRFADRCCTVGAQINEIDVHQVAANPSIADSLLTQEYDFLGERYNHGDGTMTSTEKTMGKLRTTWQRHGWWTFRQMATHFGVLYYSSSTARIEMFRYHDTMRYFADTMRRLQQHPELWDTQADPVSPGVRAELTDWTETVLVNAPVPIPDYGPVTCDKIICFDASGHGWAGICLEVKSGAVRSFSEQWPRGSRHVGGGSTITEPAAAMRAACRFLDPRSNCAVLMLTDHEPLVHAHKREYAVCWDYNKLLTGLRDHFKARFFFQHIKGVTNPVDLASRGLGTVDDEACASETMKLVGSLTAVPSTRTYANSAARPRDMGISFAG